MDADKTLKIEDIIRGCILRQFLILIFVYIIGGALFLLLTALYFTSIAIVPWRIKHCFIKFRVICQKIRLKYKGKPAAMLKCRPLEHNRAGLMSRAQFHRLGPGL